MDCQIFIPSFFTFHKKFNKNAPFCRGASIIKLFLSLSVSRVLSCTVIYLDLPLPTSSSDIHGNPPDGQPYTADAQSCSGWGLHGIPCHHGIGELLPRLSILTRSPLRFISVALSLKSPSLDVIKHPVLCCSDFPHDVFTPRDRTANSKTNILYHVLRKKSSF